MIWVLPKKTFSVNDVHMTESKFKQIPIGMHLWLLTCPNVDDFIDEEDAGLLNMRQAQLDEENRQTRLRIVAERVAYRERQEEEARKRYERELAERELCLRQKDALKRKEDEAKRIRASAQERFAKEIQGLTARITMSAASSLVCDAKPIRKTRCSHQRQKKRLVTSSMNSICDHDGYGHDPYCDGGSLFRGYTQYGVQMSEGCYRKMPARGCY